MPRKTNSRTQQRESAAGVVTGAVEPSSTDYSHAAASVDRYLPVLFLALSLFLGTWYAFFMPPMQVADEMMHFARAYSVSQGVCIASPDIDIPKSFARLNEMFPHWMEKQWKIAVGDLPGLASKLPLNDHDMAGNGRERSLQGFINQNAYFCAPYLPEAAILNAGRHAGLSPLTLMYLCRMTNLAFYIFLTFLALRLLPDFRCILFCVALIPMALHQAASVSADSPIIAVTFLFTAYVFRLAFSRTSEKLRRQDYLILLGLLAFLALSKAMICPVFLLLLIPAGRFPSPRSRWLAMAGYFLLVVVCVVGWQQVNQLNMQREALERAPQGVDVAANLRFAAEHPLELALMCARSFSDLSYLYNNLQEFVGKLGWLTVQLPDWLVWMYFALLMAAATTQTRDTRLTLAPRGMVLLFTAAAIVNTLGPGWALEEPKVVLDTPSLWEKVRVYSQGRYWVPVALPMLVLFSTGKTRFHPRYFAAIATGVILLASAVGLYGVGTTYYFRSSQGSEPIDQLDEGLHIKANSAEAYTALAIHFASVPGRSTDAVSHLEAALRMDPNLVEAHESLGFLLAKMPGRAADAIAQLDAAVRLEPRLPQAQRTLGILLSSDPARTPEAIAHLEIAQRLQPDPEVQRTLDHLREKAHKPSGAASR